MSDVRQRLGTAVLSAIGHAYIRLARLTMRLEYRDRSCLERVRGQGEQYILAFWHSRLAMMTYGYPDDPMVALISRHRDARMLGRIHRRFGVEQAWGSSTVGGASALRGVLRRVREGYNVGITPDGPRGPRRRAKTGVVAIARLSGLPVVPVAFSARPATRIRSWDGTLLPWLFARGLFVYADPLRVPREATPEEQEQWRQRIEAELDRLTDLADRQVGRPVEEPRPPWDVS